MSDSPDAIRSDIERTRRELGSDVDALTDKVTPSKVVDRQKNKVKRAVGSMTEHVMGTADDAQIAASDAVDSAVDSVKEAAHDTKQKVEGNPLAVGLMAFGAGLLASSLIPASTTEKKLAARGQETAEPLVDEVKDAAKGIAEHLQEPAMDAAEAVKERTADAVDQVVEDASSAVKQVKEDTTTDLDHPSS